MDMIKLPSRRAVCAGMVAMGLSAAVMASTPGAAGLGLAWPNARDVSTSTHWHVYVFDSHGVPFVQVNDRYGNVRVAFAELDGRLLVLPMGRDARRLSTALRTVGRGATAVPLAAYAETIYRDGRLQVRAVPMSDGTTAFVVTPGAATTGTATPADDTPCDDPEECSSHSP
jgi:hypothetical protein